MPSTSLDRFQQEVLDAFFRREDHFFLTGGAALAGFYLGHRTTKDLDFFTTEDRLDQGVATLHLVAQDLKASIETVQTAETFRRFLLRRGQESVVVDMVRDLAPQIYTEKPTIGLIRIDPPEEILVNKLCALLSRAEIRDLVDIYTLAERGYSIDTALGQASKKDGGMTPGQLAWVVSDIQIGKDVSPPGGVSVEQLCEFLEELQQQLTKLAFPS